MQVSLLDEVINRVAQLPPSQREEAISHARAATRKMPWVPNPGPQTDAYFSEADVLLYGGEPGGGKSQLIAGLAYNAHHRSLIMRRQYGDLDRLVEDVLKIHGSRNGFNGSPPPKLRIDSDRTIDFAAAARVGDEHHHMGKGHDFLGIDEATHFAEMQVRFLMGWVRTERQGQRTRTVLATNPPLTAEGLWVSVMFAPWLDEKFANPAKPGELRWAVSDLDDKMRWVDGPGRHQVGDRMMEAKSYTFIPASVNDNPNYARSGYQKELDSLPESIRSILMGGFKTSFRDQDFQIIPTAWVREAIDRWGMFEGRPPPGVPMCAVAADCTGGGTDPLVISTRYDGWFDKLEVFPGREIPMDRIGRTTAGHIVSLRRDQAVIVVDMGGGYGGPAYEHLKTNFDTDTLHPKVIGFKGAEASVRRSKDKQLGFKNRRTEVLWRMREALDPDQVGGSQIMLPDDPELIADLTAPVYEIRGSTISAETKEDVCKRLGRSTDKGDAVCMCWNAGPTASTDGAIWDEQRRQMRPLGRHPEAIIGRHHAKRR
ncbi:MAG: terminase [Bellilinea sp.]